MQQASHGPKHRLFRNINASPSLLSHKSLCELRQWGRWNEKIARKNHEDFLLCPSPHINSPVLYKSLKQLFLQTASISRSFSSSVSPIRVIAPATKKKLARKPPVFQNQLCAVLEEILKLSPTDRQDIQIEPLYKTAGLCQDHTKTKTFSMFFSWFVPWRYLKHLFF